MFLNGDGESNRHVAFKIALMRGQFDALLNWPFEQKVTFMLISQKQRENFKKDFFPDPNSSCFRRPSCAMNVASGLPLFCPFTLLYDNELGYVVDDVMFARVVVTSK